MNLATTTQNLGLIKPAGTDKIRIAQINSNMDTIDTKIGPVGSTPLQTQATNAASSISALQSGMAIICNGNTHAAIASGQYAYVKNHSTLSEGMYQATAPISTNDTLSTSNLSAVSGGGLNEVKSRITWGEASTPSDHKHYIDISRGSYNNIIACIRTNANYNICAFPYSGSAFRVIIRSSDGSFPSDPVTFTYVLLK